MALVIVQPGSPAMTAGGVMTTRPSLVESISLWSASLGLKWHWSK